VVRHTIILDKEEKLDKYSKKVSWTVVNLAGSLRSLNRLSPSNLNGSINTKNSKHYKYSKCGYFYHNDVNAAFNISKKGDKTLGEKVPIVGSIDSPLNWSPYKGGQSESSGGAR
jgi:hypothetical protein